MNYEHRKELDGESIFWRRGTVKYDIGVLGIEYFRNKGHYHWEEEGDIFGRYKEQNEEERYLSGQYYC